MNKAELEDEIKKLAEVALKVIEDTVANRHKELAELNKAKTGRVKIGNDLSGVDELFWVDAIGVIRKTVLNGGTLATGIILQGRTFYDQPTAELFALREKTEFKIWCEFGNDVKIVYKKWQDVDRNFKGVNYNVNVYGSISNVKKFLDTLSEEELNSIKGE